MNLKKIYLARKRINDYIRRTPLEHSQFLSKLCKGDVWLKLENLQLTRSFKLRGALNKLLQLSDHDRKKGIITASSGNHAQGVGYVSRILDFNATIVVPKNTPKTKLEAIKQYEVEMIKHGNEIVEAEKLAKKISKEEGQIYISSYNDEEIIAGAGTIGLEMIEERPELDTILVPVGGGGLISGVGQVFKVIDDGLDVIGIQSLASPTMYESIKRGHIVEINMTDSIAEGVYGGIEENSITFDLCRSLVDDFILVQEDTILRAIRLMLEHLHQVIEGAGAIGIAALMENPERFKNRKVGIVVSGGNLDLSLLKNE
jgi:threonine dehydratase